MYDRDDDAVNNDNERKCKEHLIKKKKRKILFTLDN